MSSLKGQKPITLLIFKLLLLQIDAYSTGAPDIICDSMLPGHGNSLQTTIPPYKVTLNTTEVFGGGRVILKLEGSAERFKGFFIQGHTPDGKPVGTFHTALHKTVTCGAGVHNAVTHGSSKDKNTVTVEWEAPLSFEGDVQFSSTVVQKFVTYWVGLKSDKLRVSKRSAPEGGSNPTSQTEPTTKSGTAETSENPHATNVLSKLYDGCDVTKTCYGSPDNCVKNKNCKFMVTYTLAANDKYEFELLGRSTKDRHYVAVGLSEDATMGEDSVVVCKNQDGIFDISNSWNDGKSNKNVLNPKEGLKVMETAQFDGQMYCHFQRDSLTRISNKNFNLKSEKFYILVAEGVVNQEGQPQYHNTDRIVNTKPVSLGQTSNLVQRDTRLFKIIHGSLMVGAWIMAASCGILFARYFKQTWLPFKCCNIDAWFHSHRFFMILTWCCTITAFVLIVIELKEFRVSIHSIVGIVSIGLCFIQPFIAALRCHPGTSNRWIFNWVHWFVGNSAQILGIAAIFLGFEIFMIDTDVWIKNVSWYILIVFIAYHCLTHVVLSITQCLSDRQRHTVGDVFPLKEMNGSRVPLQPDDKRVDSPYGCFRKFVLSIYLIVNWFITALLILIIVVKREHIEKTLTDWNIPAFWEKTQF